MDVSLKARYFMLYEFKLKSHPELVAFERLNHVLKDEETIALSTIQHWFRRFRARNYSLENDIE